MNQTDPSAPIQDLARRVLAFELAELPSGDDPPAARVCKKLRRPISELAGTSGFRALLSRALAVSRTANQSLIAVQVKDDGTLHGLESIADEESAQAGVALVSQLIGLLVTFIGEFLTIRLMHDIWPDLPALQLGGNQTT